MQKTLGFYKDILSSMHYTMDDEGLISVMNPTGVQSPAEVEGLRLCLPTKARLKAGFGDEFIGFHPLSENMARRGTSPVIQHMQRTARAQLAYAFVQLSQGILRIAGNTALHKDLPPSANEILKKLQKVDDATIIAFDKLLTAAMQKNRLITVYLKNGGTYEGKKVNRLAVIRFPIMEALDTEESKVLGVTLKPKQRETILALLNTIMPGGADTDTYSAGSNNRTAPYLHAFLQAYRKAIVQLNKLITRYAEPLALPIKPFPVYDEEILGKFSEFYDEIPQLNGNEGEVEELDATEDKANAPVAKASSTGPIPVKGTQPVQSATPLRQAAQQRKDTSGGIDFDDLKKQMTPQPAMMPMGQMQQQFPMQQYPMMGGVMPQMQPANPFSQVAAIAHPQPQPQMVPMGFQQPQQYQQWQTVPAMGGIQPQVAPQIGQYANTLI